MSLKLKEIELRAFRAFKDKKILNFENKEFKEAANLVVIYAPNGTGKTSFFDAVEWGMSGKIQRISKNKAVSDIAQLEKKYILKNKEADADHGAVLFQFDEADTLMHVETKRLDGRQKTDYSEGYTVANNITLSQAELTRIIEKNLLTHDQIDNFLRFKDSADRYNALKPFWDKENQTEDYTNLILIAYEIQKMIEKEEKNVHILTQELEKIETNPEIWQEINQLKITYATLVKEQENVLKDAVTLRAIYFQSLKNKSTNEETLNKIEKKQRKVKKLYQYFLESYRHIPEQMLALQLQIANHEETVHVFFKIEELNEKVQQLEGKKLAALKKIKHAKFFLRYQSEFEALEQKEQEERTALDENIAQRKSLEEAQRTLTQEIQKQNEKLNNKKKKLADLKNQRNALTQLENHLQIKEKRNALQQVCVQLGQEKKELEKQSMQVEQQLNQLTTLLALNKKELLQKNITEMSRFAFFQSEFLATVRQSETVHSLKNQLKNKKKELKLMEKLGSEVEQLKKIGYKITTESKLDTCPLCAEKHTDMATLLEKIQNSTVDFLHASQLVENIQLLEAQKEEAAKQLDQLYAQMRHLMQEKTKALEIENDRIQEKALALTLDFEAKNQQFMELQAIFDEQQEKIKQFAFSQEDFAEALAQQLVVTHQALAETQEQVQAFQTQKQQQEQELEKVKAELALVELANRAMKHSLADSAQNDQYQKYLQIRLRLQTEEQTDAKQQLKIYTQQLAALQEEEYKLIQHKTETAKQIQGTSKAEVLTIKKEQETQREQLIQAKKQFEEDSVELFSRVINENNDFITQQKQLERQRERLKKQNDIFSQLIGLTNHFMHEHEIEEKKAQLARQTIGLKKLSAQLKKVEAYKVAQLAFIKEKIDRTFNLDIVNQIFQMIEPHPAFKEISFRLNDHNPDRLGLDILCEKSSEQREAPILYFSSAQINILSLSIFLGTALENTDKLNVILMDDPIQHLDSLNELSFIDLLRIIAFQLNKQVIFSTHSQQFFKLCKQKLNPKYYPSRFIELTNVDDAVKELLRDIE